MSFNQLPTFQALRVLGDLPRLIIADFVGNPACADREYRSAAVYTMRRLKVCTRAQQRRASAL